VHAANVANEPVGEAHAEEGSRMARTPASSLPISAGSRARYFGRKSPARNRSLRSMFAALCPSRGIQNLGPNSLRKDRFCWHPLQPLSCTGP
jgi:hypothetical protein